MDTHPKSKSILLAGALFVFSIFLPMLFHPTEAWAVGSAITGTVVDPTGAAVPDASVKVHNTDTGVDNTAMTNGSGVYHLVVPAGVYDVSVQKSGFKMEQFTAITLTVDQVLTLNASLEVGAVTQMVEVSGQSVAPIDLQDGQISNIVEQQTILDMPLITRDPYQLTLLSPGVIESTTRFGGFSANGTREKDNNFLLDGVDNNDTDVPGGEGLNILDPDSTQEFRVITNNFAPEYGRNNGAIIDVITKSGTNQIHGDAYWFGRYDVTGARDFFNETPGTSKYPYERNIIGGSAGGPLIKDKTFWFANYEGNRWITTTSGESIVPNAAFRTGMFNAIDPATGASVPIDVSSPTAANNGIGLPLDPTIQKILALYPTPTPGTPAIDNADGQYFYPNSDRFTSDNFTVKIDHHLNEKNTLSGRYVYSRIFDPNEGGEFLPPNLGAITTDQHTQNFSLDWTSTLRPNLVNDLRIGANRTTDPFTCQGTNVINSFGPLDPFGRGTDYLLTDEYGSGPTDFGCTTLGDLDNESRSTGTYQILEGLNWIKGTHTLKFGWEGRDIYSNSYDNFGSRTTVDFAPEYEFGFGTLTGALPAGIGLDPILNDEVAMLLGFATTQSQSQFFNAQGVRNGSDLRGFRQKEFAFYGQDAWKVRPNLTLNYGLRWEYYGVPFDANDNFTNLFADPSGPAPFTFTVVGPGHRPAWDNEYANFEPRVGFAWDPFKDGKTSIRGGYGIFHDRVYGNLFENSRGNPPFQEPFTANPLNSLTGLPAPTTVPTSATVQNFADGGGFVFPILIDPQFHTPYSENWNFGIQRQLTDSLQLEIEYVGVRGLRLFREVDGNPPQPGLVKALEAYCKDPTNAYGCVDSADASTLTSYNLWIGQEEGTLPFDAVNNNAFEENCCTPGADLAKSIAKSSYDGLQINVTQRLSHGIQIQTAYTWSHTLDNASDPLDPAGNGTGSSANRSLPRNSFNLNAEYGNSDFDVRQRLSINFIYQPNIGRGRAYLNSGMVGKVMEGWELSGIATFQTGQPFDIFGYRDDQHTGLSDRPEIIAPAVNPTNHPRLQTGPPLGAFTLEPYDSPSNVSRNRFFGPGINVWNTALIKNQALTEGVKLQIRFEFYNLFNHPDLGIPDNGIADVGTFGTSYYQVGNNDGTTGARQIQFGLKLLF